MKTMLIINPASAHGSTGKLWPSLQSKLNETIGVFEFQFTDRNKPASKIASIAIKDGFERLISVGGDGTFSEVVNGYFSNGKPINKNAIVTFIMNGTGADFQKTFGISGSPELAVHNLRVNREKMVDVGKITLTDKSRQKVTRYFINIASFGMGGEIVERMNRMKILKLLGGKSAFYLVTLYTMLFYKNTLVNLQLNGEIIKSRIRNIAIANGRFHGGGMMIAPDASIDDGMFDIIILGDMSFIETLLLSGKIYQGKHLYHPKVKTFKAKQVKVNCESALIIEADGENIGSLPADFEIIPKALRLQI